MASQESARRAFEAAWPEASRAFSPYTRLPSPILCESAADEAREGLQGSFAMIRMRDQRIVIGLSQIVERGLEQHAHAILAHEVGHHVHAPGNLLDMARMHDRIRRSMAASRASFASMVSNLYADLIINDRLQREGLADLAAVYRALRREPEPEGPPTSDLWRFYMRTYELLWSLPRDTLVEPTVDEVEADAQLAARLVRIFRKRFLDGAPPFAKLVERYLDALGDGSALAAPWLDATGDSLGDQIPGGLLEDDFDPASVEHPSLDPRITGEAPSGALEGESGGRSGVSAQGRSKRGDGRLDHRVVPVRGPAEWLSLLRSMGVTRDTSELLARYYADLASPHLIPFPAQRLPRATDPLPEGLEAWEPGAPLERIDWLATLLRSPVVVPGITTVQRVFGEQEGGEPEKRVPDLYVGIDCSGSMGNPAYQLAYPSSQAWCSRAAPCGRRRRVMACLSGEWHGEGRFVETPGFLRDESKILKVLVDYLGTGASFGLGRLVSTFVNAPPPARPVHLVVVSDSDLFAEIDGTEGGWDLARRAIERAGGGATAVLRVARVRRTTNPGSRRMRGAGFTPELVGSEQELVAFARAFARRTFGER
jgi:hypothetical protein